MLFDPSLYLSQPPVGYGRQPLPWSDLKFNPLGLYSLRQCLGMFSDQPGIFTWYQQSFLVSDLAWYAAGASKDRVHHVRPNTFHPLFSVSRENTPTGVPGSKLCASVRQHLWQLTLSSIFSFCFPLSIIMWTYRPQFGIEHMGGQQWLSMWRVHWFQEHHTFLNVSKLMFIYRQQTPWVPLPYCHCKTHGVWNSTPGLAV